MRRLAPIAITILLLTTAARAAAPPPQWLPRESWPGGRQYDARLERTVTFWGTGVPAAGLFAGITKQTGVALGFDPPDDDNARICLNVYLNPKEPPTLRDVLVQVGWVMDCAWAVEGKGEQSRYVLLHTDLGEGAVARLEEEQRAMREAEQQERQRVLAELRPRLLARIAELREALKLSREEAIRRYRGKDDMLLVPLLKEPDRTALQAVMELADPIPEGPSSGRLRTWQWSELTAGQRARLRVALQAYQDAVAPQGRLPSAVKPADVPDSAPLALGLGISTDSLWVSLRSVSPDQSRNAGGQAYWPYLMVRARLVEDPLGAGAATGGDVGRQFRAAAQKVEEQRPTLRPSTWQMLAAVPWHPSRDELVSHWYTLWQVQEFAAVASRLNLLSDCFWQPPRGLDVETGQPPSSLLDALRISTFSDVPRGDLLHRGPQSGTAQSGWEWNDAGSFLCFRSRDRDLMRAAFLPQPVAQALGEQFAPHAAELLEKLALARERARHSRSSRYPIPVRLTVALGIRQTARLATQVTALQARWGGDLTYADPASPQEAYQRAYRSAVLLWMTGRAGHAYRLIASLDDDGWSCLNDTGLRWGEDFTFRDRAEDPALPGRLWTDDREGDLYRIEDPEPQPPKPHRGSDELPPHRVLKGRIGSGDRAWEAPLLLAVWVEAQVPEHLVLPPPECAP
jgi:hypothetical protein